MKWNVETILDYSLEKIVESEQEWKRFCMIMGENYRYSFENIAMICLHRPDAQVMLDYDSWKLLGRYVKRGSIGTPVFRSALTNGLRHVFDVKDTAGEEIELTWDMDAYFSEFAIETYYHEKEFENQNVSIKDFVMFQDKEICEDFIKDWTRTYVCYKIKEDFKEKILSINEQLGNADKAHNFIASSVFYTVCTRCGFDTEDIYLDKVAHYQDKEILLRVGHVIRDMSNEILSLFRERIKKIRAIRSNEKNRRNLQYGHEYSLQRERRIAVSGDRGISAAGDREIRQDADGLSAEEPDRTVHPVIHQGAVISDGTGGRSAGSKNDRQSAGDISHGESAEESQVHAGELPDQADDRGSNGGNHQKRSDLQLNQENEIPSRDAYQQVSLFQYMEDQEDNFVPDTEELEAVRWLPQQYMTDLVKLGTGVEGSRFRILDFFQETESVDARYRKLSIEYQNAAMVLDNGDGIQSFNANECGVKVILSENGIKKQSFVNWGQLEKEIQLLILDEEYLSEEELYEANKKYFPKQQAEIIEEAPETASDQDVVVDTVNAPVSNYRYSKNWMLPQGAKSRFKANVEAICLLKELERENRNATRAEQEVLSKYVGWGSMSQVFDHRTTSWAAEYEGLKALLSIEEYMSARSSVNTSFYTPDTVIHSIYSVLEKAGLHSGKILEPSMGVGNFFSALPKEMNQLQLFGVELDNLTGRIAKKLFPYANIQITGFEKTQFKENFFDAVIGNIPFGDFKVFDKAFQKEKFKIHDYFFAKALESVKPNGLIAFVTSKGTMDRKDPAVRQYIAERADLLGAVRLPDHAFKASAGTEVTTDIIFLRKREQPIVTRPDWIDVVTTDEGIPLNVYFMSHPEMLLGKMEYTNGMFGDRQYTTCVADKNMDLKAALEKAVEHIQVSEPAIEFADDIQAEEAFVPADPNVKNFTYVFANGELYYREHAEMIRMEIKGRKRQRIMGMDRIRKATRELIDIQMAGCTEAELKEKQKQLNWVYDAFVREFGYITDNVNRSAFRDDSDYPLLSSLEVFDEDNETIEKADIFTQQTIRPKKVITSVDTAVDALTVSLNVFGKVNLPFMLSIYSVDREKMLEELKGLIFMNPSKQDENNRNAGWETADDYLSGNVRAKLKEAKVLAEQNKQYDINVERLEKVQPTDLDASEIFVKLGVNWIDVEDYSAFVYELLDTPSNMQGKSSNMQGKSSNMQGKSSEKIQVLHNQFTSNWFITNKGAHHGVAVDQTYGTGMVDAYTLVEESLNMRTITVYDITKDNSNKNKRTINQNATMLARAKQDFIKEKFKEWLWQDIDRREKYVRFYNENFNNTRLREYDGSYLQLEGKNPEIQFRDYQLNAVARSCLGGNTLLAHCVGAGKSFVMIAAVMEMKRLGMISKAVMVVPNHLTLQMGAEFLRLYPTANILVTTQADFETRKRKRFVSKIATGNYDAVVIGHSQFQKIPMKPERQKESMEKQLEELSVAIDMLRHSNGARWSIKQMETRKKSIQTKLEELLSSSKDDTICFEELGIDYLVLDEAHYYKNMPIFSKMNNVSGFNGESQKAVDMLMKCDYISELHQNRGNPNFGLLLATGTPITNSMSEMYVFQRYLQHNTLLQKGLYCFDDWAASFGETTTALELAPEGSGYRFKTRFNKFVNVPELLIMFKEIADIQLADMIKLKVPDARYVIAEAEPDEYTKMVMEDFVVRAENIRSGAVDKKTDNMLKITMQGRLLGTDARLLDAGAPNNPDGKLNQVVENTAMEYFNAKAENRKATQLLFSDVGTPRKDKFNVYDYLKSELIKRGIPEQEIAFAHDAKNDEQRQKLFRQVRKGKVKILIGSTFKLGVGTNVQTYITAMHDVDCPLRPSDLEQRGGRGIRHGNKNKEVRIYRYVTKGTFDAFLWGIVENKQRFISQIMSQNIVQRTCEDIDETVMQFAELKAIATGNPAIKEKIEIDNEIQRLQLLKASYHREKYQLQNNILKYLPQKIAKLKGLMEQAQSDVNVRDEQAAKYEGFEIRLGKKAYKERASAGDALLEALHKVNDFDEHEIGMYKGFAVSVCQTHRGKKIALRAWRDYSTDASASNVGNIVRLENLFNTIERTRDEYQQRLDSALADLERSKKQYEQPFAHEDELNQKMVRQGELNVLLNMEISKENDLSAETPEGKEDIVKSPAL